MISKLKNSIQHRRMIASIFIVVLLFVMLQAISGISNDTKAFKLTDVSQSKLNTYIEDDGSFNASEAGKDLLNIPELTSKEHLPVSINSEVLDLSNRQDLRVSENRDLLSFIENLNPTSTYACLKRELESKGWESIESNSDVMGTFIKGSGEYRWLSLTCIEQGNQTIVLMQLEKI